MLSLLFWSTWKFRWGDYYRWRSSKTEHPLGPGNRCAFPKGSELAQFYFISDDTFLAIQIILWLILRHVCLQGDTLSASKPKWHLHVPSQPASPYIVQPPKHLEVRKFELSVSDSARHKGSYVNEETVLNNGNWFLYSYKMVTSVTEAIVKSKGSAEKTLSSIATLKLFSLMSCYWISLCVISLAPSLVW